MKFICLSFSLLPVETAVLVSDLAQKAAAILIWDGSSLLLYL
ncbi:hypothetical protein [Pontibacter sp. SGAir0037]|nr:hypothetical protein [Pontibacter sp. SGAir0037]